MPTTLDAEKRAMERNGGRFSLKSPACFFTRRAAAVDFLPSDVKRLLPIETKSHDRVSGSDGRNLETFLREFSPAAKMGLVVYSGNDLQEIRKNIWAVPDWYLFACSRKD